MYKLPRDLPGTIEVNIPKNSTNTEIECKIRFRDKENSKLRWNKIRDLLSEKKDLKCLESFTIDYYRNGKRITKIGEKFFNTTKSAPTMLEVVDFEEFDLKFTIVKEKNSETKEPKTYDFKRIKERVSFLKGNIRIDLTKIIHEDDGVSMTPSSYEVEVEVIEPSRFNYVEFVDSIMMVIETQVDPHKDLIKFINISLGDRPREASSKELNGRLISKPRDLLFRDLTNNGLLDHYAVSVKADGEFRFMVFHNSGIWLVQNSRDEERNFERIGDVSKVSFNENNFTNSIFAGEIVKLDAKKRLFLPFDCCRINGKKVVNLNYLQRREYLSDFYGVRIPNIIVKEKKIFTYEKNNNDFYRVMKLVFDELKEVSYGTDGLVFTPIYSDYVANGQKQRKEDRVLSRYQDVCKYKLPEDQTIDFEVIDGRLFSAGGVLFKGSEEHPFGEENYTLDNEDVGLKSFDIEGRIVEFKPYYGDSREYIPGVLPIFKPYRFRDDKPDPNALKVALDGWNIQKDPILPSTLKGEDVRLMRKYNNTIKREMIRKMSGYVVDIGTGKGGDLSSYHKNRNIISILGVEPNEEFISEMKSRPIYKQIHDSGKFDLIKGGGEETERIVERLRDIIPDLSSVQKDDKSVCVANINFMISLSFFWKDDETLEGLVRTINTIVQVFSPYGCKVFVNYFTIMGDRLKRLFKNHGSTIELNTITLHRIDENSLQVDIRDSQTVHKQEEYFVNLDQLFEKTGFKSVYQETPLGDKPGDYILSDSEKSYDSLFSYGTAQFTGEVSVEKNHPGPLLEKHRDDHREKMDWIHPDIYRISTLDDGKSLEHSLLKLLNFDYRNGNIRKRRELVSKINLPDDLEEVSKSLRHGIVLYNSDKEKKTFGDSNRWVMLYQNKDGTYEPLAHLDGNKMSLVFSHPAKF